MTPGAALVLMLALGAAPATTAEDLVVEQIQLLDEIDRMRAAAQASRRSNDLLDQELAALASRLGGAREWLAVHREAFDSAAERVRKVLQLAGVLQRRLPMDVALTGRDLQQNLLTRRLGAEMIARASRQASLHSERETALSDVASALNRASARLAERTTALKKKREDAQGLEDTLRARLKQLREDPALRERVRANAGRVRKALRNKLEKWSAWNEVVDELPSQKGKLRYPFVPATIDVAFGAPDKTGRDAVGLVHRGVIVRLQRDISKDGVSVRTVAWGRVEFSGRVPGYGPTVIVDHGRGYHGVYAGFDVAKVNEGDVVKPRASVGYFRPAPRPPRAVFELWLDGEPLDPTPWFQR